MKVVVSLALAALFLGGCSEYLVRVMPYEKEYFAQDKMKFDPLEGRAEQDGHFLLIREASAGGESAFQGGCGCR